MNSKDTTFGKMGIREFIFMMGMAQALQALAIDAMLPALGIISQELGVTSENQRQLVIGIFLIFAGLGSLVPGTLADRYGRRPVMLACLGGYVVFTLAGAFATSFPMLLASRAILGLFSAGLTVLPAAIIRDRMEGDAMARMQSTVILVFMVVPMLAPSMGQAVLLLANWRWIFGAMAILGLAMFGWVYLRLPETMHSEFRQPIRLGTIVRTMGAVIITRSAIGYVIGMGLIQGAMFGYINSTQQLMGEHFGAGTLFPLIFGGMALCMAGCNFINAQIVERFGARRVSHTAVLVYICISSLQLWLASRGGETLWQFVPVMTLNMCLMGFIGANFGSISLQPFAATAGAAASVQAFIRMVMASVLGAVIGHAYDGTAQPLAFALLGAGLGSLILVLFSEKGRLFRRLIPAGGKRIMP